jgi:hypothetical protein
MICTEILTFLLCELYPWIPIQRLCVNVVVVRHRRNYAAARVRMSEDRRLDGSTYVTYPRPLWFYFSEVEEVTRPGELGWWGEGRKGAKIALYKLEPRSREYVIASFL